MKETCNKDYAVSVPRRLPHIAEIPECKIAVARFSLSKTTSCADESSVNNGLSVFPWAMALSEKGSSCVVRVLTDARFLSWWRECWAAMRKTQDRPNVIWFNAQDYGQRNAFIMAFRLHDIRFDSDEEIEKK